MKMLVLGHKGMLGTALMRRLGPFHTVVGKDVEDFDITSPDSCRGLIAAENPAVVINAAAYTNVDGAESDAERCFAVNATGVKNLVAACQDRRIPIVHFSTDYVFGGTAYAPYREEDTPSPRGVYAASKAAGERYLQEGCNDYLLIRTAWLYGPTGKNFVKTILEKALRNPILRVVDDQVGSPTYSLDLAGAVALLLEQGHRGIFHVTNRGACSWCEFTRKILALAGFSQTRVEPITTADLGLAAPRPSYSVLSSAKFTGVTGKTLRFWPLALEDFLTHLDFRKAP
ncbi:MAG: dTDP-4-dehydrorhamnose reductase [Pseudomonadota bacterium]|nr:dTDP-4-dehydrorhamnose reductase [Pseudomonadota bacterium]